LAHQTPLSRRGFSPKSVSGISRPLHSMKSHALVTEFERASIQLMRGSNVLSQVGAALRAVLKASDTDREALASITQTYIDDWAEILYAEANHFDQVSESHK
ncbi:hypothetical protein, partial [Pseudomonas aeruginosa]